MMARAIVMMRGEDWRNIKGKLASLVENRFSNKLFNDDGVIIEYYMPCFGWFDFLVSLWGGNVERLRAATEHIREICDSYTTSIIGVPTEEENLTEFQLEHILTEYTKRSSEGIDVKAFLLDEQIAGYLKMLNKYRRELEVVVRARS